MCGFLNNKNVFKDDVCIKPNKIKHFLNLLLTIKPKYANILGQNLHLLVGSILGLSGLEVLLTKC